ncbi:MAG: carboxypeptidase-like regulatory domain-containing protein [Anaerosomatales bacterium]|nr:carboxypeptidase-like regulatory domain-containing protein [Anaerosomatales bacterium]MDT8433810.1 carboxypeptidase-like regulatory domain-containing protein [Anaerosomatales bacterium]
MCCTRITRITLGLLAVVLVLSPVTALAAPPQSSVSGTVTDDNGLPIAGATIVVNELKGSTFRLLTTVSSGAGGEWGFAGKPNTYRFDFSAPGTDPESRTLVMARGGSYTIEVTLPSSFTALLTGEISGVVVSGTARTPVANAYIWLYKQNDDGTWPATSPGWGSPTVSLYSGVDGTYSSGPLALGNYRIRFFTVHTGSQWWEYVTTFDQATTLTLSSGGQVITGIDGWFYKP